MKLRHSFPTIGLLFFAVNSFGQTPHMQSLFIPFLDKDSQSNIIVNVCDFSGGQPSPMEYTNVLSNTNLFTPDEQRIIRGIFLKYKIVTTNSGPSGTVLSGFYITNHIVMAMNKMFTNEIAVSNFQYTNFDGHEEIKFGGGVFACYRNKSNDGYNASFARTGSGTLLSFGEIKHNRINGLFARFDDNHPQGLTWDYRLAEFGVSCLEEYKHYTNAMVIGKFLMWNPQNGNLMLEAEFKEPYDFEKHRIDLRMVDKR